MSAQKVSNFCRWVSVFTAGVAYGRDDKALLTLAVIALVVSCWPEGRR